MSVVLDERDGVGNILLKANFLVLVVVCGVEGMALDRSEVELARSLRPTDQGHLQVACSCSPDSQSQNRIEVQHRDHDIIIKV